MKIDEVAQLVFISGKKTKILNDTITINNQVPNRFLKYKIYYYSKTFPVNLLFSDVLVYLGNVIGNVDFFKY